MCLAAPGKVIKVDGQRTIVQYPGETREAMTGGETVKKGDRVLVQMGIIVQKLSPDEAASASGVWATA